jgi:hypothetical protein
MGLRDLFKRSTTARSGTVPAGYLDCFLSADDLPGMRLVEDNRTMRAFDEDGQAFPAAGGLICGLTHWAPQAGAGRAPRAHGEILSDRLIDLRWMFADAKSAAQWHRDRFAENSENMPPLGSHTAGGIEYHCFGGQQGDLLRALGVDGSIVSYNFLFVAGPILAKVFVADTESLGLTTEQACDIAHRAGERISQATSARPGQQATSAPRHEEVSWNSVQSSDLFSWFSMSETGRQPAGPGITTVSVAPGANRASIELSFDVDSHSDVVAFSIALDRNWLDHDRTGLSSAADLTASVIRSLAPADPILDDVGQAMMTAGLTGGNAESAPVIMGAGAQHVPTNPEIGALAAAFITASAPPATVRGHRTLHADNQRRGRDTWFTVRWQ